MAEKENFENVLDGATQQSKILEVPLNGQLTFVALGLREGSNDRIEFELIKVSPALAGCDFSVANLPGIAGTTPLRIRGKAVTLTADSTFVIVDAPQGFKFRVVYKYDEDLGETDDSINVMMSQSSTPNVTPEMRGYF